MCSPLSSIIADLVMRDLEEKALKRIRIQVPFYFRYEDNIAMAIPSSFHDDILDIFNSFHSRLQFTMERGVNNLNFFDVTIKIVDNTYCRVRLILQTYFFWEVFKFPFSTFSHSETWYGMTDRAFLLSHPRYHQKN